MAAKGQASSDPEWTTYKIAIIGAKSSGKTTLFDCFRHTYKCDLEEPCMRRNMYSGMYLRDAKFDTDHERRNFWLIDMPDTVSDYGGFEIFVSEYIIPCSSIFLNYSF